MDAVVNALTDPWSNGRAGIELLRRRFLAMGR